MGFRLVGEILQPEGKLACGGDVVVMQVAVGKDGTEQALVAQGREKTVGGVPVALLLGLKDAAVGDGIFRA